MSGEKKERMSASPSTRKPEEKGTRSSVFFSAFNLRQLFALVAGVVILAIVPGFQDAYYTSFFFTMLFYIILAEAWVIFSGYTGYVNLGPVAAVGAGAFIMAYLQDQLPFILILLISALAGVGLAFVVGLPSLRIRGAYFAILTLGVAVILQLVVLNVGISTTGTIARTVIGPSRNELYYYLVVLTPVSIIITHVLRKSKMGLGLISIRSDEEAAEATGINTTWYKLAAFAISFAIMGMMGPILASRLSYIDPYGAFNPLLSFEVVVMAVLGGSGDALGPILGSVLISTLSEVLSTSYPFQYEIILGAILIIVVLAAPRGLSGIYQSLVAKSAPSKVEEDTKVQPKLR